MWNFSNLGINFGEADSSPSLITVFTITRHWFRIGARWIHSTPYSDISLSSMNLSFRVRLGFQAASLLHFSQPNFYRNFFFPHAGRIHVPPVAPWLYCPNTILWEVQTMKLCTILRCVIPVVLSSNKNKLNGTDAYR